MQYATIADILRVEDIFCIILDGLSAAEVLSLARASTAFRFAVRPRSLGLSVHGGTDLRVLQSLKSLGSLEHLQHATTQVDPNSSVFKETLRVLATCPSLKRLDVKLAFSLHTSARICDLLAVDLLRIDCTIAMSDLHLIYVDEKPHHFFRFPAGAPLSIATMEPCLKAIFRGELSVLVGEELRKWRILSRFQRF